MKRRNVILGFLLLSSALAITAVLIVGDRKASGQNDASGSISRINDQAALLNTADETQIRQLADEVFTSFDLDQAPSEITNSLKDRLVSAEVNYRRGHGKPVSEFGVVRMTNTLMDKLGAPAYAKTNVFEVRRLEMNFLPFLSKFIGKRPVGQNNGAKARGSSINPIMSPLEGATIAGLLIQQKRSNPTYQVTQDEWVAKHVGKGKAKGNAGLGDIDQKRSDEIEQAIQRGTDALSVADLFKLSHQALDKLGVARSDGRTGQ